MQRMVLLYQMALQKGLAFVLTWKAAQTLPQYLFVKGLQMLESLLQKGLISGPKPMVDQMLQKAQKVPQKLELADLVHQKHLRLGLVAHPSGSAGIRVHCCDLNYKYRSGSGARCQP